jgi:cellobiose phosphorylase
MIEQMQESKATQGLEKYGSFSPDGREFIISHPMTPAPWMNVLCNPKFGSIVSQTGSGYSFFMDPLRNRITRWDSTIFSMDIPGKYLFIKDEKSGDYWTINGMPGERTYDAWEARHGLGYTTISARVKDIEASITYFVPLNHSVEIWMVKLRNLGKEPLKLSVYPFVDLVLGNSVDDLLKNAYYSLFNEVVYKNGIIWATKNQWTKREQLQLGKSPGNLVWNLVAYFSSSLPVDSFTCDKEEFVGPYRSPLRPAALELEQLGNLSARGKDAVAVLQHRLILEPGNDIEFQVALGVHPRNESSAPAFLDFLKPERTAEEFARLRDYWEEVCTSVWLESPDAELNRAFNWWLKYQFMNQLSFGDGVSREGSYGTEVAIRDSAQNLLALLIASPEICRQKILWLARFQYFDGDVAHGIVPLLEKGSRSGNSDHQLWIPYLVSHYCRETGDFDILDIPVPYHDRGEASILEHCVRAIGFVLERKSSRGIPLILNGDFDEMIDHAGREGKGESVWLAMFLVHVMKRFLPIFDEKNSGHLKARFLKEIDKLSALINEDCWDGEWYTRALRDDGGILGSKKSEKGQIFLLPQAWAIISGVAPRDRGRLALASVASLLDTSMETRSMSTPFTVPDQSIGIITRMAPGKRENGGFVKTHAIWRLMAESLYGNGDLVYELLKKYLNITNSQRDPDIFKAEPYIESEYIDGPDSSECGRGSGSWEACSASWVFRLLHDWIIGIRIDKRGMKVDPCLPHEWQGFTVKRKIGDSTYVIKVSNPDRICKGVSSVVLDGSPVAGGFIPILKGGQVHQVEIVMGKAPAEPGIAATEAKTESPPPQSVLAGEEKKAEIPDAGFSAEMVAQISAGESAGQEGAAPEEAKEPTGVDEPEPVKIDDDHGEEPELHEESDAVADEVPAADDAAKQEKGERRKSPDAERKPRKTKGPVQSDQSRTGIRAEKSEKRSGEDQPSTTEAPVDGKTDKPEVIEGESEHKDEPKAPDLPDKEGNKEEKAD